VELVELSGAVPFVVTVTFEIVVFEVGVTMVLLAVVVFVTTVPLVGTVVLVGTLVLVELVVLVGGTGITTG
jgi:hypothetical protein